MRNRLAWILAPALLIAACSKSAPPDGTAASGDDSADAGKSVASAGADAPPADGRERFYGRETYTIVFDQTGMIAGSITEHVRDYGRRRAEITKTTTSVAGMSVKQDTRLVAEGAKMTTVDNQTGAVTTMTNPMYDGIVAAMKGKSGVEVGEQMMRRMGAKATGEKASFAGHDCEYWTIAGLGSRSCVTPWGATLHISSSLAGMSYDKKAIAIRMGDGGPDAAFAFDASRAKVAPNLNDIMRKMKGG